MAYEEKRLSDLVDMENPDEVFEEVRGIVKSMYPKFDFTTLEKVFGDIKNLFHGEYHKKENPEYRKCNTKYHDLDHTTDAFLAMARLMHGAYLDEKGEKFTEQRINLGLICALMHDTGYIQTVDDTEGTGAKYTQIDSERSIEFMGKYLTDNNLPIEDIKDFYNILKCTGLGTNVHEIKFKYVGARVLGQMLGTADLIGQMGDKKYLEKLHFLYLEFKEGKVSGFESELDLLRKTPDFWKMAKKRFAEQLGGVNEYLHHHFNVRFGVDRDLYAEAIEKSINYLESILEKYGANYRDHLRRVIKK